MDIGQTGIVTALWALYVIELHVSATLNSHLVASELCYYHGDAHSTAAIKNVLIKFRRKVEPICVSKYVSPLNVLHYHPLDNNKKINLSLAFALFAPEVLMSDRRNDYQNFSFKLVVRGLNPAYHCVNES